jgi:DNA-binding beta-propeller fold protein YncE
LLIAGLTLTVTQAGATYVAATNLTLLVATNLNQPAGLAVDGAGNVYIADTFNNAVKEWSVVSNTVTPLVASGLDQPYGLAMDGSGNLYIADLGHNMIQKWVAASNTLVPWVSGLVGPYGVAVDGAGNVYIADTFQQAIKEWVAVSNTVVTLVSTGLNRPGGVAVDVAGNVYIADTFNHAIEEWVAASNTVVPLLSTGTTYPYGVAVDGAGHVFVADGGGYAILKWSPADHLVATQAAGGLNLPEGVAVDGAGNLYIADMGFTADVYPNAVLEQPHAWVDATAKTEPPGAGGDGLPAVLPATANLTGPFAPASDSAWLTITGITNGVVSFAFTANPGATNRTANLTLLGQTIAITQTAVTPPVLTGGRFLGDGAFQFGFTNQPGGAFTIWTTTNLTLPLTNWMELGPPAILGAGQYLCTDPAATNGGQRFYRVSSP